MKELNLPAYSFKLKEGDGTRKMIYDEFRNLYVSLTPEEWVRQHFAQYLVNYKAYPRGRLGVEVMFRINRLNRRADILVYNDLGNPLLIVECKAPAVKINEKVFNQILNYNLKFRLKYIIVTNGIQHYACRLDWEKNTWSYLESVPRYEELSMIQ